MSNILIFALVIIGIYVFYSMISSAWNDSKNKTKSRSKREEIESVFYRSIESDTNVIYESSISKTVDVGNLVFHKEYEAAIKEGKELLKKARTPGEKSMVHINLTLAYFKSRKANETYLSLSTEHAKQAVICGHNTGFAQRRLAINLEKEGKINQAIQICDIVLSPKFNFSRHAGGTKEEFQQRRDKLNKKLKKLNDTDLDKLFSEEEEKSIYRNSKVDL